MPSVEWVEGNSAGPHRAPVTKLVLHTTEGGSIEGACAAYQNSNSWPHLTVDPDADRICRHLPFDVSARSLKNLPGGIETNTAGVIQVEVVGFAAQPWLVDWEWVGRNVVGPVCREVGIPVQSSVTWVAYPDSYGRFAAQRLGFNEWLMYMGVLGHQHVPENDHGDPGAIPIEIVLDAAQPPPPPRERNRKTMDLCHKPDSTRVDMVVVGVDNAVWHYYAENADAFRSAPGQSLGGWASEASCAWSGEVFIVTAHGKNDRIWSKTWSPGTGWSGWDESPAGDLVAG